MRTSGFMASASRFAHLAGLSRTKVRADTDDDRSTDAEDDDKDPDASDDDDDTMPAGKKGRKGKAKRANDDDRDPDAEDDDKDPDAEDGDKDPDAEDDDKDPDAEDDGDEKKALASRDGRLATRRCAAIFGHKAAAGNIALAASLAFETKMSSREAIAVLRSQEGNNPTSHRADRASRNPQLGTDRGRPSRSEATKASWDQAFAAAGIKPRK